MREVRALTLAFEDLGNPFEEESKDLFSLDTKVVKDPLTVQTVKDVKALGRSKYETFVTERFIERSKSIMIPLEKSKLPLFSTPAKQPSKQKAKISLLQNDCALFSRLYIACQSRDGNLPEFFKHENHPWPPSLSSSGDLRSGNKANLLSCLKSTIESEDASPTVHAKVLDGAVVVQMLSPGASRTFEDYAALIFLPYVMIQLQSTNRLDIVWDLYKPDSLKQSTRDKRGSGIRQKVLPSAKIPRNWASFLRVNENKTELFQLLAKKATEVQVEGKQIVSTFGGNVLCMPEKDVKGLEPCSQEEADSRIMLHVLDAAQDGNHKLLIRTADTDVVVIAVSQVQDLPITELWVAFGVGKHFQYIPVHKIATQLGPPKARSLGVFHAITGCDSVSFFLGIGKKKAWDIWTVFPAVTDVFLLLAAKPDEIPEDCIAILERFVVLLYDKTSEYFSVNEARLELFSRHSRALENIPPTHAALKQHILRATYQAGFIWNQCLTPDPKLPSPSNWGWELGTDGVWKPRWTDLPQAQECCYELIHCGCKKACRGLCKCFRAKLKCTALCQCGGNCFQDD